MWLLPKGADKLIAQLDGKAKNEDHMGDIGTEPGKSKSHQPEFKTVLRSCLYSPFPQVDWIWVSWSNYQWRRKKAAHFNLSDRSFWAILSFFCLWLKERQFFWSYCSRNAFHCWHGLLYCWTGIWHPKVHDRASSIGRFRVLVLYT